MSQLESEDFAFFRLIAKQQHLEDFADFIVAGSEAEALNNFPLAEKRYRMAVEFAQDNWGPYCWMVASALMHLSGALDAQGRKTEAKVAESLSLKILDHST